MVKTRVIRLRGVEGRNVRDQIAFHSFLVEIQTNAGYMPRMRNNNLQIKIAGSSCRHSNILKSAESSLQVSLLHSRF